MGFVWSHYHADVICLLFVLGIKKGATRFLTFILYTHLNKCVMPVGHAAVMVKYSSENTIT